MPKHRKPSKTRKALRRLAALLPMAALTTGAVLATAGPASASTHQHTAANDARMCAAFNHWANHDSRGDAEVWARYLPGTDGYLYRDGLTFAWAIKTHAPPPVLRNAFEYVWQDCSPDA